MISVCRGGAVALQLSTHRSGSDVTVAVDGEVDLATVGELESAVAAAVADGAATTVIVDVSGVKLLDSAGIGALLKGRRQADERGRHYRVIGAAGIVAEVLRITGVYDHLVNDAS
jgi:anti-anti-sigma factor